MKGGVWSRQMIKFATMALRLKTLDRLPDCSCQRQPHCKFSLQPPLRKKSIISVNTVADAAIPTPGPVASSRVRSSYELIAYGPASVI